MIIKVRLANHTVYTISALLADKIFILYRIIKLNKRINKTFKLNKEQIRQSNLNETNKMIKLNERSLIRGSYCQTDKKSNYTNRLMRNNKVIEL